MTTFTFLLALYFVPFPGATDVQYQDETPYVIEAPDVVEIEIVAPGTERITGKHIVQPDGTVNLKQQGAVFVSGLTVPEARQAILKAITADTDASNDTAVFLTVVQENSKAFYMVVPGSDGDKKYRLICAKNETAASAVLQVEGAAAIAAKKGIRIERITKEQLNKEQLCVDWQAITQHGELKSNHKIHPGDRILFGNSSATGK